MSDRRIHPTLGRTFEADNFKRCPLCQAWFDRSDRLAVAQHRGHLPHPMQNPRTAWADEDDEGPN
jgi:hypothetical protein